MWGTSSRFEPSSLRKRDEPFPIYGKGSSVQTPHGIFIRVRHSYPVHERAMPRRTHTIEIDAAGHEIFAVMHDYDRRLTWDSMLSRAVLLGDATEAAVGVTSLCVGTWKGLWLGLETTYVRRGPSGRRLGGHGPIMHPPG